jgi:hypothetical protein
MGEFRWQFRLRSMLVLVVIAALLMSAGLWGWKMRQRWVTNLQWKSFYQANAASHANLGSAASKFAHDMTIHLESYHVQDPSDKPFIENIREEIEYRLKEAKLHARRQRIYERAATHPWDPVLPWLPDIEEELGPAPIPVAPPHSAVDGETP